MRIPEEVIESLDQNGINVSSAWLRCDVDVYNETYGDPLTQPVSLEAVTINEFRFLDDAGTITIRMTDSPTSLVIYSSYVEFVEDGIGGNNGQAVAVDDVTIDWNNASQLEVKDAGISTAKIATEAVTNAKLGLMPAGTVKGRAISAGLGGVSDIGGADVRCIVATAWVGARALASDIADGLVELDTTSLELSYVHGVTSSIQDQLDEISVHNNLSGLQGGISGEYYHLTSAQATTVGALTGWATKAYTNGSTTDVAEGTNLYFTNARADARIAAQKGVASGLATLDVGGKVPLSQLPATTIVETFVVASQAAMLALTAQQGDVCVRTDLSKTYILKTDPASTLANWQELLSPVDGVQSVGLSATGPLSVSGSPITSSGTLALSWSGSAANFVMANGSTVVATNYMAVSAYPDLAAIEALAGTSGLLRKTAANTWSLDTNTYLTGNQTITLSGDVSGSGTTAITATLASVITAAGPIGNSTTVPVITYDAKGRLTTVTTASIAFPVSSVFGRTGAVVAASGDYTTAQVTESTNLYFTEARVRSTPLTGYAVGTNTALAATDTILAAFGKVQAQINATPGTVTSVGLSAPSIFTVSGSPITSSGTLAFAWNGSSANLVRADGSTVAASTYLTGNQTITLSGVVTGSGTTAITTAIADGALSIAKTSGLQTALNGKLNTGLAVLLSPSAYQAVATYALGVGGGFRATGYDVSGFTSNGPGVEVHYDSANTRARIMGYNRTSAARIELAVDGSPINFYANGTLKGAFSSAGDFSLVNLTASRALVSDGSKNIVASAVTSTELGYLSGVTSSVQTQINGMMSAASYPDLVAIEALTGTAGYLKKTAANTWTLVNSAFITKSGTNGQIAIIGAGDYVSGTSDPSCNSLTTTSNVSAGTNVTAGNGVYATNWLQCTALSSSNLSLVFTSSGGYCQVDTGLYYQGRNTLVAPNGKITGYQYLGDYTRQYSYDQTLTVSSGASSGSFSLPLTLPSAWGTNQFRYQRTYKVIGSVTGTNNTSHTAFEAVFNLGTSWMGGSNYYWKVSCNLIYINDSFVGTPSFDYGLNSSTTKQVAADVSNLTISLASLNSAGGTTITGRFHITEVVDSAW